MKTNRNSRFLQVSLPIQFTDIFQAYIEIGRKKCFVKRLVLRHTNELYGFEGDFLYFSLNVKNNSKPDHYVNSK